MGEKFKAEKSLGGTVKRLMVCSLCGPATIWSDALFQTGQSFLFKPTILLKKKRKSAEVIYIKNQIKKQKEAANMQVWRF